MNNNRSLPNDIKNVSKVFKDFFSKYGESFLAKLPDPSNKYNLESVFLYYLNLAILEVFHIKSTSEEKVFKIQKKNRDFQSRRYRQTLWKIVLKFYLSWLVKSATSRFFMEYFLMLAKLQNSNLFTSKAKKLTHLITVLSRSEMDSWGGMGGGRPRPPPPLSHSYFLE